jgi:hypothetical protein
VVNDARGEEHFPVEAGRRFIFGLDGEQNLSFDALDLFRFDGRIIQPFQSIVPFSVSVFGVVVTGSVGQEEHAHSRDNGEYALEGDGNTPAPLTVGFGTAIVNPVRQRDAGYEHDRVEGVGRATVTDFDSSFRKVGKGRRLKCSRWQNL